MLWITRVLNRKNRSLAHLLQLPFRGIFGLWCSMDFPTIQLWNQFCLGACSPSVNGGEFPRVSVNFVRFPGCRYCAPMIYGTRQGLVGWDFLLSESRLTRIECRLNGEPPGFGKWALGSFFDRAMVSYGIR